MQSAGRFFSSPRERRFWEGLFLLWTLSMFDLIFTLWAHRFTPFIEINPLASRLLGQGLLGGVVGLKFGMMLIGSLLFWHARKSPRTELAIWGLVFVFTLLMIRWSNYTVEASEQIALAGWDHIFPELE